MSKKLFSYQDVVEEISLETIDIYEYKSLKDQNINVFYYTNPLCCYCWGLEPVLKRLSKEYGNYVNLILKMGNLQRDLNLTGKNRFSSFLEIESYWKKVGQTYGMPISGKVWEKDPLFSSYQACSAYIAAKSQGVERANVFFRKLTEALFIFDVNISKEENLQMIAKASGLNSRQFMADYKSQKTLSLLEYEISETSSFRIDSIPTIAFLSEDNFTYKIKGVQPYSDYVQLLEKALGYTPKRSNLFLSLEELFDSYDVLSLKEIVYLLESPSPNLVSDIEKLCLKGFLEPIKVDFGFYWKKRPL